MHLLQALENIKGCLKKEVFYLTAGKLDFDFFTNKFQLNNFKFQHKITLYLAILVKRSLTSNIVVLRPFTSEQIIYNVNRNADILE